MEGEGTRHGAPQPVRSGALVLLAGVWLIVALSFPSRPVTREVAEGGPDRTGSGALAPGGTSGASEEPEAGSGPSTSGRPGSGGAPTPGPAGTAVTKGGVPCVPGVPQVPGSSYSLPCVPAFTGTNGGATARGVTDRTIRVVRRFFAESANDQAVSSVIEQAGGADAATVKRNRDELLTYLEQHVELYGRRVEWIDYESRFGNATAEAQGRGREGACLDAEVVASELRAFAVLGDGGPVSQVFAECAVQRGVVVLDGATYATEKWFQERDPYAWSVASDCERIGYQTAEYMTKRLAHRPAKWAGDPNMRQRERVFGVYGPLVDDRVCIDLLTRLAREGGFPFRSTYFYTLDVSRFADEAARAVIQFKRDGVTTLVLACDPISVIFLTQAAKSQGWRPEWVIIGAALTDTIGAARLYDQQMVDGHLFGMSALGSRSDEPSRVYQAATGRPLPPGSDAQYFSYIHSYNLLMAGGPDLTAASIRDGIHQAPPLGAPDFPFGTWYWGDSPDGSVGDGDHTAIGDTREVYWVANGKAPDGKAGTYVSTYGGRRFSNGEWPAEEPPIYP